MIQKTLRDLKDLKGKTVLLRVDYNVPIQEGKITDNSRITKSLPTIKFLLEQQAKIVLFSHLGRVKTSEDKQQKSLIIVVEELIRLLNQKILFVPQTRGKKLEAAIKHLNSGQILVVENTRFEDLGTGKILNYESGCDEKLSKYWASLGEIFVNDAFGTLHRKHASNYGIAKYSKESAVGFLVEEELKILNLLKQNPARPFIVILGGAKVSDKVSMIDAMLNLADKVIIGPAMSYTFNLAEGKQVGNSLLDESKLDYVKVLMQRYADKLFVAFDSVAVKSIDDPNEPLTSYLEIPSGYEGVDLGEKSTLKINEYLQDAKTIFWNGPLGIVEIERFAKGSRAILEKIMALEDTITVIGGGDSGMMAAKFNAESDKIHISTGGGASMKFLEGKKMEALEIIDER